MKKIKTFSLAALQISIVALTVIAFRRPQGAELMLMEIVRGLLGAIFLALLKILSPLYRPQPPTIPMSRWCRFALSVTLREARMGLVGGLLLGVVIVLCA